MAFRFLVGYFVNTLLRKYEEECGRARGELAQHVHSLSPLVFLEFWAGCAAITV